MHKMMWRLAVVYLLTLINCLAVCKSPDLLFFLQIHKVLVKSILTVYLFLLVDQLHLENLVFPWVLDVQCLLGAPQNRLLPLDLTDPADQGNQILGPPVKMTALTQCHRFTFL